MPAGYERLDQHPPDADQPARPPVAPFSSSSSAGLPFPVTTPDAASPNGSGDPFTYPPVGARRSKLGAAKWKGKGRATDSPSPDGSSDQAVDDAEPRKKLVFCVRFTDGQTEDLVDLWVGEKETVREVKRRIRLLRPDTLTENGKPRRLRLIQLGRLLPDGVFLLPYTLQLVSRRAKAVSPNSAADVGVKEGLQAVGRGIGKVVRGTMGERAGEDEMSLLEKGKGREDERGTGEDEVEEEQIWLHCSVGEPIEDEEPTEEKDQTAQITPLQGFDRLRDAGFSEQDIENLRAEFRDSRQTEADDEEHQRALEEQWMSGMTGQEEAVAGDSAGTGHYYSLLKGVCIGFFVPFLPLFFFRTQIFTRRMQIAVILGIVVNLGFGILRLLG
ncbi:DSC E3 ubiquitin ligase complex subunit 3 [Rhodotorula toruloides]|nr:DSC E3 ubiquitin ligase complex subunit 3 [Rhodotorula toruloides]